VIAFFSLSDQLFSVVVAVKKQISTGFPWCGLLFTTIYVITWSKFVADSLGTQHFDHVMM
jgi:hypothetical protein